jgi:hypothetical protein
MKNKDIFLTLFWAYLISGCGSSGGNSATVLPAVSPLPATSTSTSRLQASYDYLMMDQDNTFTTDAFLPDINTQTLPPSHVFEGKLTITGTPSFALNYGRFSSLPNNHEIWPEFSYQFVQDNGRLIPVDRGHGFVGAGGWSITAGVGAVWDEVTDNGYTRAAFPYTIKQRNANCEANGLATFLFNSSGSISKIHVQNVAETCQFYGFEFYGTLDGQYQVEIISNKQQVILTRNTEEAGYFPSKPLSDLAIDYPAVELTNYGYAIEPDTLNGYSVLVNGISYLSGCITRYGEHPYCSEKTIGLYSFTKSMHGFMLVAALEKQFPGFKTQLIKDLVPECSDSRWDNVTVEHALDMTTGNFQSSTFSVDESSSAMAQFYFNPTTRQARADFACNGWPQQAPPGTISVYHTTDTELVGYAAAAYAKLNLGENIDAFDDVLVPIYQELGLSHYIRGIQRTTDTNDAWGGYGLSATVNDVIRLAQYLRDEAISGELLDSTMVNEVLTPESKGFPLSTDYLNYDNGFWRLNVGSRTQMSACGDNTQVPMMSGYGGHTLLILPDVIVTQFTDGGGLGIFNTVDDIFSHISNSCP